ncbi:hypothetical protein [Candidatus Paracaedibacter symbiosus]|uniref:hypothetical protein n=1 Tax=Candidatus Paracaedibacter symbiosus TaxID=244582 RepID=UPI0018DB8680|nr:hypothetical protein [Candidatus Paracaedibacter symbiosus]
MMAVKALLEGYRLTTVEILYRLPDHPHLLQAFIWQDYDLPPEFPRLMHFLEFWAQSIDGKLYSVQVASAGPLILSSNRLASFYGKF